MGRIVLNRVVPIDDAIVHRRWLTDIMMLNRDHPPLILILKKYFLLQLYRWVIILYIHFRHQGTVTNMLGTKALSNALSFYFRDSRSHGLYTMEQQYHAFYKIICWMLVSGAQYLQIIRHCTISHLSLLGVCGKWTFMYCNRLLANGIYPFSAA